MDLNRIAVVIPTLNAGEQWPEWIDGIRMQNRQPDIVLVIDSSSDDDTVELARNEGYNVHSIERTDFNHGKTRQLAVEMLDDIDIVIFLTQDAILTDKDSLENIVSSFDASEVGTAYGRQLPRRGAGLFEAHARLFNYPDQSRMRTMEDVTELGLKTAYTSNSYAAYRVTALNHVGGFPDNTIVSEDMHVAARMLLAGWTVHYNAAATVEHSHSYTMLQEFRRYFDVGVFLSRNSWIPEKFGYPGGEGKRFFMSEFSFVGLKGIYLMPLSIMRSGLKLIGYNLGKNESKLPIRMKRRISMQKAYWKNG